MTILLRRLCGVGLRDWPEVLVTTCTALAVELGLRTVRLPRLAGWCGVPLSSPADENLPSSTRELVLPDEARRRLVVSTKVLRHWPFDEKCLRLSLVCGRRIRRLHPRLVLGVAIVGGEVKAHAWLLLDGMSLDPSGSGSFFTLRAVPGS